MRLELPSLYIPYNFKSVNLNVDIGPIFIPKFARAVEEDNMAPALEALQTALDVDVGILTEGDFYYALTVMRIMVYKRNPLVARWTCTGSEIFERNDTKERWNDRQLAAYVELWESSEDKTGLIDPNLIEVSVVPCDHQNEEPVTTEDLIIHNLPDNEFQLDPRLDYPRAALIPEAYELSDDLEYGPFVRVAKWVRDGETLIDKIELVQASMDLYEAAFQAERTYRHGVTKFIVKSCAACGNQNTLQMEVNAASFL